MLQLTPLVMFVTDHNQVDIDTVKVKLHYAYKLRNLVRCTRDSVYLCIYLFI